MMKWWHPLAGKLAKWWRTRQNMESMLSAVKMRQQSNDVLLLAEKKSLFFAGGGRKAENNLA